MAAGGRDGRRPAAATNSAMYPSMRSRCNGALRTRASQAPDSFWVRSRCPTVIVITIAIFIGLSFLMKTIQMTMENALVERVDARAKRLGTTRSAFARDALRAALQRFDEMELEERQIAGYRNSPPRPQEFDIPEADHAWGDAA